MNALTPELEAERETLLREVSAAFDGVSREGRPSWSDAEWADTLYEDSSVRALARSRDRETDWHELPDNPVWVGEMSPGTGSWGFLDACAYRYYLPAALVVCLRSGEGNDLDCLLTLHSIPEKRVRASDDSRREYQLKQWSLLDDRQRRCVYRFLILMRRIQRWINRDREDVEDWVDGWTATIESHWHRYAEDASSHAKLTLKR